MVDTTVPPASNDEPEKKGVGLVGGAAALAAGGLAGVATGAALYKTAENGLMKKAETLNDKIVEEVKKAHPQPAPEASAEMHTAWQKTFDEELGKLEQGKYKAETEKLLNKGAALGEVAESNFFKKGMKVAFNGGAKVQAIVAGAAVGAALLTGYIAKKIRNGGSHVERVEQERAAAPAAPSVS